MSFVLHAEVVVLSPRFLATCSFYRFEMVYCSTHPTKSNFVDSECNDVPVFHVVSYMPAELRLPDGISFMNGCDHLSRSVNFILHAGVGKRGRRACGKTGRG